MQLKRLALLSFCLLSVAPLLAEPLTVPENANGFKLLEWIEFKPETPDMVGKSPREIDASGGWKKAEGELDFGFTSTVYWFRFSLRTQRARRIVLMADAAISRLMVYKLQEGAAIDRGLSDAESHDLSLNARGNPGVIRHRRPAVELELSRGDTRILLRMQNEQLSRMPLTLWDARVFNEFRTGETLVFGLFFGSVGAIALYNFLMFLSTREMPYGVYVIYALMAICYSAAFQGFHIVLMPWVGEYWLVRSVTVFVCLFGAAMNWFARSFLQTRFHAPVMDRIHIGLALLASFAAAASVMPFLVLASTLYIIAGLAILSVVVMIVSGWIVWKRGFKPARFYILAIALFTLGASANSLRIWGVIPHHFWIQHSVQLGIVVEMILLSLALSDRINTLKKSLEKNLREIALAHELNLNIRKEIPRARGGLIGSNLLH